MAGFDDAYQTGPAQFWSLTPSGDQGTTLQQDKTEAANNLGAFLQMEIGAGEHVKFLAGIRYDDVSYSYTDRITPALDDARSFTQWTPKLGVAWLVPTGTVYANLGGGTEVPAYNEVDPPAAGGLDTLTGLSPLLKPMSSTTYEIGARQRIRLGGDGANVLRLDGALYLTDVTDDLIPYAGGRYYFNAGKTRRQGIEIGAELGTAAGITLRGSASFSDNTLANYVVDSTYYGVPGATADFSGNQYPGVPAAFYQVALGWAPTGLRFVRFEVAYQGSDSYYADAANTITVPGYGVFNVTLASATPVPLGNGLGLRGFVTVNNVANRNYAASAYINPDYVGGVPVYLEPGLPTNVVVSLAIGR